MGHNSVVSGHPKSTEIPRIEGLSTGPTDLGRHTTSILKGQKSHNKHVLSSSPDSANFEGLRHACLLLYMV